MPKIRPDSRLLAIGSRLRSARLERHLSNAEVCDELGWDKSALSRMEYGLREITYENVADLVTLYRIRGRERETLLASARALGDKAWWDYDIPGLPREATVLARYESMATSISHWAPLLIPGLLQTPEYTTAWLSAVGVSADAVQRQVDAREKRRLVLRGTVQYTAFIGEVALWNRVGSASTCAAQLVALRRANDQENVSVRVVPARVGPHEGQLGPFVALTFPVVAPIIMVELLRSSVFLDEAERAEPYLATLEHLDTVALGETESLQVLTRIQERWSERARPTNLA